MRPRVVVLLALAPLLGVIACAAEFAASDAPGGGAPGAGSPEASTFADASGDSERGDADGAASSDLPVEPALAAVGTLHASAPLLDVVVGTGGVALFAFAHQLSRCTLPACSDLEVVYATKDFTFVPPLAADTKIASFAIAALQGSTGTNEFLAYNDLGGMNYKVRDFDVMSSCLGSAYIRMGTRDSVDAKVSVKSLKKATSSSGGVDDPAVVRSFARDDLDVKVPMACDGAALYYANPDDRILYSSRFSNAANTSESRTPLTPAAPAPITALGHADGTFVYAAGPDVYACTREDAGSCTPQVLRTLPSGLGAKAVSAGKTWLVETNAGSYVEYCATIEGCTPTRLANAFRKAARLVQGGGQTYVLDDAVPTTAPDGGAAYDYPIYRLPAGI